MLTEIKNQKEWNELVLQNPPKSGAFLQSWQWGEFQQAVGHAVYRNELRQIIEHNVPFGNRYWYFPRANITQALIDEARTKKILFIRFEPPEVAPPEVAPQRTIHISPPTTLIINLEKTEDELFTAMHEKTRYNIRLAARKGVNISNPSSTDDNFEKFWQLMKMTAERDGFRAHPRAYYQKMLTCLEPKTENREPSCFARLWIASLNNQTLAAGIWIYFGDTVTYLHGASSNEHRDVMAPHLLHWEVMRDAKSRGYRYYDFWGITREQIIENREQSWGGITRFKKGFGGEVVEYPGTYDLPISRLGYTLYKIVRRLRRL